MEAPICLIENTADDKLVVNPKALNILSTFNQPLVVVSIVGMYRTGKSYLMNKLVGTQKGFDVGSTVRAQTKGIWMWCVPHPTKKNHTLVLLDTEGLGDVEKGDGKSDTRIFALALLLSSAMVYNSKGTIDQDAMDKLKFVGEISELVKIKSEDNEDEEAEFSSHFPVFVWAVRDFHLGLELDGKKISEDDYLENALKLKTPERTIKEEDYNRPRKRLRMYFGTRKCFTFGFPSADTNVLQNLEKALDRELNDEFVVQCQKFCNYVFKNIKAKSVRDMLQVTGPRLGQLVKIYTDAITNSKFACMEEAVISLAEQENRAAVEEATKHYVEKIKTVPLPTETLSAFLELSKKYEDEARQMFLKRSFKDNDHQFLQEFMKNLLNKRNEFNSMNEQKSQELCEILIKKHALHFEKALTRGAYHVRGGHAKFRQDLKAIGDNYKMEKGKGVKAEEVLQEYMTIKQSDEISIIQQDNALTLKEKEAAEENNRRQISEMEANFRKQLMDQQTQMAAANRTSLEQTVNQMTEKMQEERRTMNENMERVIREKAKEQELYMKQGLQEQAKKYEAQMNTLQQERGNTLRLLQEKEQQSQQLLKMHDDQIRALQAQIAQANSKPESSGGGCIIL